MPWVFRGISRGRRQCSIRAMLPYSVFTLSNKVRILPGTTWQIRKCFKSQIKEYPSKYKKQDTSATFKLKLRGLNHSVKCFKWKMISKYFFLNRISQQPVSRFYTIGDKTKLYKQFKSQTILEEWRTQTIKISHSQVCLHLTLSPPSTPVEIFRYTSHS